MSKIEVNKVAEILKKHQATPEFLRAVIEELNLATQPDTEEKAPPIKKQFVVILSDPEGTLCGKDLVGWVAQMPEAESPATIPDRILKVAELFNTSKKGAMLPVKSVGECLEDVPARIFKDEAALWIKTKTPVQIIAMKNDLPDLSKRSE